MPVLRCFFPFSADSSLSGGPKKNFRRDCQCALLWPRNRRKSRRGEKKKKAVFGLDFRSYKWITQSPDLIFRNVRCCSCRRVFISARFCFTCVFFFTWNTSYILLGHGFFQPLTFDCLRSAPRGSFCVLVWRVQPWSLQEQWRTMGADTGSHLCTIFCSTKLATLCGKNKLFFFLKVISFQPEDPQPNSCKPFRLSFALCSCFGMQWHATSEGHLWGGC